MTRTATPIQRRTRWSPGCALLDGAKHGSTGSGMPDGHSRPEYVNQLDSRGSSPV